MMTVSQPPAIKFGVCPVCVTVAAAAGVTTALASRRAKKKGVNNGPEGDKVELRKEGDDKKAK